MSKTYNGFVVCTEDGTPLRFTTADSELVAKQRLASVTRIKDTDAAWQHFKAKGYTIKPCVLEIKGEAKS